MVRIAGSHPAGPGSIPGGGINFFFISLIYQVFAIALLYFSQGLAAKNFVEGGSELICSFATVFKEPS